MFIFMYDNYEWYEIYIIWDYTTILLWIQAIHDYLRSNRELDNLYYLYWYTNVKNDYVLYTVSYVQ